MELPYLGGVAVIHTPGHTLGHICLYLKDSRILIAGDALDVEEGRLVPAPASTNYNLGLCKQSLQKLAGYVIQSVICYHGGLYEDQPLQRITTLRYGTAQRGSLYFLLPDRLASLAISKRETLLSNTHYPFIDNRQAVMERVAWHYG